MQKGSNPSMPDQVLDLLDRAFTVSKGQQHDERGTTLRINEVEAGDR